MSRYRLTWSEPAPPTANVCSYDHVVAETPLGRIRIEWKSWKILDTCCAEMPWGEFVYDYTVELAKIAVQKAWDRMIVRLVGDDPVVYAPLPRGLAGLPNLFTPAWLGALPYSGVPGLQNQIDEEGTGALFGEALIHITNILEGGSTL